MQKHEYGCLEIAIMAVIALAFAALVLIVIGAGIEGASRHHLQSSPPAKIPASSF